MNRGELKSLADLRLKEARALINKRLYDGAYYLTGYAVECGLKACIAKKTKRYDFPDKRIVNDSYTHDLNLLIKVSGLQVELEVEIRYVRHEARAAQSLYAAVTDSRHGVLRWLKRHW